MHHTFVSLISFASLTLAVPQTVEHSKAIGYNNITYNNEPLVKRAGKDFGTFQVDCKGSEEACNNACWYIYCGAANQDPDRDKLVYAGSDSSDNDRNRFESGCRASGGNGGSVCREFPFSQAWTTDPFADGSFDCDEWPPALSQQSSFGQKRFPNSLSCVPSDDNQALGRALGAFLLDTGGPYPGRPAGRMVRDDYFRVDFKTKIGNADQKKVHNCLNMCTNEGRHFSLTSKATEKGSISSPYNRPKERGIGPNDNRYKLDGLLFDDLYQCSVELTRVGDFEFQDIQLFDYDNKNVLTWTTCASGLGTFPFTCGPFKGLPNDIELIGVDSFGKKDSVSFRYAPGKSQVNHFEWNRDSEGNGRGPATDAGQPRRYCHVTPGGQINNQPSERIDCWFPCRTKANGKRALSGDGSVFGRRNTSELNG